MVNGILWHYDLTKSFNLRLDWWSFLSKPPPKKNITEFNEVLPSLPEQNTPPPPVFNGPRDFCLAQKTKCRGSWEQFKGTSMPFAMTITMPNKRNWRASLSGTPWHSSSCSKELLLDRDTPPPLRKKKHIPPKWKRKKSSWNMSWMGISY